MEVHTTRSAGEIKSREVELDSQESPGEKREPGEIKRREVELGLQESPGEIKRRGGAGPSREPSRDQKQGELDPQESPAEIKSREVELDSQEEGGGAGLSRESRRDQEQGGGAGLSRQSRRDKEEGGGGEIKSREMKLGSHRRMVCLAAESFLNSCFSDIVFATLFRTTVRSTQVASHWRGPNLLNIVVRAVSSIFAGPS